MEHEIYEKELLKTKEFYFNVGTVKCRVLNDIDIVFDKRGFDHLIRKDGAPRNMLDQMRRFRLLPYTVNVIMSDKSIIAEIRASKNACSWALSMVMKRGYSLKVIVRKIGTGKTHFVSIMDQREQK